nr:unnamed protein product [Leishmania braziliensis]
MHPSTVLIIGTAGIIGVLACLWGIVRGFQALRTRLRRAYREADSVTFQQEGEFGATPRVRVGVGRSGNSTAYSNGNSSSQNLRDNYADRDAIDYLGEGNSNYHDLDDDVPPASPNAERVEGIPIEARVRPRRNLPRSRVVVHYGDQDVCLDFRGVERVPQAGPPPLTLEEKQRLEDERNRIASPELYGRAEYEDRQASNVNTPTVLLNSSLLQELQRQYGLVSPSGRAFSNYASESSVGSMSFRLGSPAGSARRARNCRQSATPNSVSLQKGSTGGLQLLRRRKNSPTRNGSGGCTSPNQFQYQANSSFSAPRNRQEDLESTSDDFEDVSVHNDLFNASREQLREFLLKQEQQPQNRLSPMTGLGNLNGFDQISLHGTFPVLLDRQVNPGSSVASVSSVGLGGGRTSAGPVAFPPGQSETLPPLCNPSVAAGTPLLDASFHGQQLLHTTSVDSAMVGLAKVPSCPHMALSSPLSSDHPSVGRAGGGAQTGVTLPHPVLLTSTASASAYHQTLPSGTAQGSGSSPGERACHVDTFSLPPNRWSSGLRSPFSLPGNDPVTAPYSPSAGTAET